MRRLHGAPCAPLLPCCHCQHTVEASSAGDPKMDGRAMLLMLSILPASHLVLVSHGWCLCHLCGAICVCLSDCATYCPTALLALLCCSAVHCTTCRLCSLSLPAGHLVPVSGGFVVCALLSLCVFRDCTTYCTTALLHCSAVHCTASLPYYWATGTVAL